MEPAFFLMVLAAAVLHAIWNALVKIQGDRLAVMAMISGTSGLCSLLVLPFLPLPAPESLPYIGLSLVLHNVYYLCLVASYRYGELSHVYPIARGVAPLIVMGISVLVLGEQLPAGGLLAVGMISVGLISLAGARSGTLANDWKPVVAALATGVCVALYTVIDGLGLRAAGNPHSYTFWLFFFDGFPLVLLVAAIKRRETLRVMRANWRPGLFAGFIALLGVWMVMWALAFAPMAYVSALRETSIVFAVLIGVVFLKDRLDLRRALAIFCTLAGTIVLRLNG